jgi:hypothetical protein
VTRFGRPSAAAAVAGLVVACLVSCDSATSGSPVASGGTTSTTGSPTTPETEETSAPPPDFSGDGLCDLLTPEEAQRFGGSPGGEPGNSIRDGHPQCQWTADTSLLIGFQQGNQSKNARTGAGITNTQLTVDGFTAVQSRELEPVEVCQVLVDITPEALVYVSATNQAGGEGRYQPCEVANQLADIVIPKVAQR